MLTSYHKQNLKPHIVMKTDINKYIVILTSEPYRKTS